MNRKFLFFLTLFFITKITHAQSPPGDVYAIVVGISDYHYIKPLNYADRDADLFTELLKSGAGGRIKPENLFLMKNDSANSGNFWSAFYRIINKKLSKGDRVYIYFAGHGDAIKGLNEYYLLLSDCQPANDGNSYHLSLGAIDMYHLKNRIGALISKGVEVILVLDACRTNELAGGYASQVFNSSVIQTSVGEIAMLATGPGQVSIEDASFGSGHGLFTYNLIDALSGRADNEEGGNKDSYISLKEIQDWVSKNVQLMSGKFKVNQNPVFCCDIQHNARIGVVDSLFSSAWNRLKQLNLNSNGPVNPVSKTQRGNNGFADTALLALYNRFNTARKENRLWGESSADKYYDQMEAKFPNDRITEDARYTLASDFINFAQQKINLYLEGKDLISFDMSRAKDDSSEVPSFLAEEYDRLKKALSEKWTVAGMMIQKAGRLLSTGDSTLLFQLKPKIYFLFARGFLNHEEDNTLNYGQALQYARDAYMADSTAAYAAECLALLYIYRTSFENMIGSTYMDEHYFGQRHRSDTGFYYFNKAMQLAPSWVNPYRSIALKVYGNFSRDTAMMYMRKALHINPKDPSTYILIGDLLRGRTKDSAIYYYNQALTLSPRSAHAEIYRKMGWLYLRAPYRAFQSWPKGMADSAILFSQKALEIDPANRRAVLNIAEAYNRIGNPDSALRYYLRALTISATDVHPYSVAMQIYGQHKKPDSVFSYSKRLLSIYPNAAHANYALGNYYANKNYQDSAILYLTRSLTSKWNNDMAYEKLGYLIMCKDKTDTLPLHYFSQTLKAWPGAWRSYYNIACYYGNREEKEKSLEYLEKALQRGMKNKKQIYSDDFLGIIRDTAPFKELMVKYFPDK